MVTLHGTVLCLALLGAASALAQKSTVPVGQVQCPTPAVPAGALNVRAFGSAGDGKANDTKAIQSAVNAAPPDGTVVIPAGTYLISVGQSRELGINLKSRMTLLMAPGAKLQALPTADANYAVIRAWGVTDVSIQGGTLAGERDGHLAASGEWGMGVDIRDAQRVSITNTEARGFWGDGFYFGGKTNQEIAVCGVLADGNRRNGMSIVSASGMTVRSSRFVNTHGASPEAGLDIEPNAGGLAEKIVVSESSFNNNRGNGISIGTGCERCAVTRQHLIANNHVADNGRDGVLVIYDGHRVVGNLIERQGGHGIRMWNATDSEIAGNTLRNNKRSGLQVEAATRSLVRDNTIEGNEYAIFFRWPSQDTVFRENRCAYNRHIADAPTDGSLKLTGNPDCLR